MKDRSFVSFTRRPLAERRRWVTQYQRSGLSAIAFAHKHDLNVWTLRGWIAKTKPGIESAPAEPPAVQEVKLPLPELLGRPPVSPWAVEVQWSSGMVVRLGRGIAASETEALLRAIRNVC